MVNTGPENFHNYLRLDILLSTYGNFAVRNIFRSRYIDLTGKEWEYCSNATSEFLAYIKITLKKSQKIQKESIETGDVNQWDLGTAFLVLRKMGFYKNGYVPQNASDTDITKIEAENNFIAQLIEVRNSLKHSPGKSVCSGDFKLWWKKAAEALLALGVSSEDTEHVRTSKDLHGIAFTNLNDEAMNAQNAETAKKLREVGNTDTKRNQFLTAIQSYTKALHLYGLPKIERATLYSNRSYAYLKLLMEVRDTPFPEDEVDLLCNLAMKDAERAIDLRPTWFKGYFRQAKVHEFKKEWEPAILSLDQALGLNMGNEDILKARDMCRSELTQVQCRDHLNPTQILNQMDTQEYIDKICSERGTPHFTTKQVFKRYEKLLKSKDPHEKSKALVFFAERHTHGLDGCQKDYEMAIKYYKEAADLGDPGAMYTLGNMYQLGNGVPIDLDVAVKLYEKSIQVCLENNYADISKEEGVANQQILGTAQYLLGRCYLEGLGKPVDYFEAAKFYSSASKNSNGGAANNLGSLYSEGQGVLKSYERATQYWKLASRRGVVESLQNLANTNLSLNNLDLAELNFSYALKASPVLTSLGKTKFYDLLNTLRKWKKMQAKNDPQDEGKDLLVQLMGRTKPTDVSALQAFDDEFHSYGVIDTDLANSTKAMDGMTDIVEKAALGLPYANILLASNQNYHEGMKIFSQYFQEHMSKDSRPHSDQNACSISNAKTELLRRFADHYRTAHLVEPMSSSNGFLSTLKEVSQNTMKLWHNKESQVDCNARICYSSIISNSSQQTVNFLTVCQLKYPQEIFFPLLHSTILGFQLENKEDALDVVIKTLNQFPADVELLRLKAELLYATISSEKSNRPENTNLAVKEIVTAFRDFLRVAPSDHREVPNAHYTIGLLCHTDFDVLPISNTEIYLAKLEMYLGKGLEAEKNLLSRFLPSDGNMKENLQTFIHEVRSQLLSKGLVNLSLFPRHSTSVAKPKETETQLVAVSPVNYIQQTDPNRIDSVSRHRNAVKIFSNLSKTITQGSQPQRHKKSKSKNKKPIRLSFTATPLNTQKLPSKLAGLKEIQLEEMDPLTDHVYTGRVLQNVTIVEDSLFDAYPSIESVLMDSNGEFQRCYFNNLDHKDEKVRKHLSFGSKLSIINPYYRLCVGGGCGIRIEDPQSVIFHSAGDEEPLCRFCLARNPQLHCSKCKRASYCSKRCQKYDCKILRHKLICKP